MPIREARYSDLRAAAEVAAAGFNDEQLFGTLMHPHRDKYYDDFVRFFEQDFRVQWLQHKYVFLVAVDESSGEVVGVGKWKRKGEGGKRRELSAFDPRSLIRPLASMYNNVDGWMWPNRAADPTKVTILQDSWPLISHYWEGSRKEGWYLDLCAVHPEYQGKGCGGELVEWGVDTAAREGVVASVISAAGKERFYGRFGFVEVGRSNVGPMSVLEGGAIMFNDVKA